MSQVAFICEAMVSVSCTREYMCLYKILSDSAVLRLRTFDRSPVYVDRLSQDLLRPSVCER